jgi:golgi-specific brefeldin A-resistance guanine nucleotide exchange factor 1
LFNNSPKKGVAFLEENSLIYADLALGETREQSLARFLKGCTRLDKRLLGDYISKPDNIELLKAFIGLFDFKNVSRCNAFYTAPTLPLVAETHCRSNAGAS